MFKTGTIENYNLLKSTGLLSVRKSVNVCPFDVYVIRVFPFEEGLLADKDEAQVITDSTEQVEYTTSGSLDVFDTAVDDVNVDVNVDVSAMEVVHVSVLLLLFVLSLSISLLYNFIIDGFINLFTERIKLLKWYWK